MMKLVCIFGISDYYEEFGHSVPQRRREKASSYTVLCEGKTSVKIPEQTYPSREVICDKTDPVKVARTSSNRSAGSGRQMGWIAGPRKRFRGTSKRNKRRLFSCVVGSKFGCVTVASTPRLTVAEVSWSVLMLCSPSRTSRLPMGKLGGGMVSLSVLSLF